MKKLVLIAVLLSCIALVPAAAAQSASTPTAANQSAGPDGPDVDREVIAVIDEDLAVTSVEYVDNELVIEFYSSEFKTVSLAPQAETSEQYGTVESRTYVVDADTTTTVRIPTPGGVSLWTQDSIDAGRIHFLRKPSGGGLISGPYTANDVRDAGIGGALGVVIAVLYEAVSAKVGSAQRGERVV